MLNFKAIREYTRFVYCLLMLSFVSQLSFAQHGHPLVGTWSGFMNTDDGRSMRALYTFSFSEDQVISGAAIINGSRFPFVSATLNPENWTVSLLAEGEDRAGNRRSYQINGSFENLDSPDIRTLLGTWTEGSSNGNFRIVIN